jgi:hypothetical protein
MTAVVDMKAYRLIGIRQKAAAQVQLKDGSYMKGNNNLTGTQELIILPSNVGTKNSVLLTCREPPSAELKRNRKKVGGNRGRRMRVRDQCFAKKQNVSKYDSSCAQ